MFSLFLVRFLFTFLFLVLPCPYKLSLHTQTPVYLHQNKISRQLRLWPGARRVKNTLVSRIVGNFNFGAKNEIQKRETANSKQSK